MRIFPKNYLHTYLKDQEEIKEGETRKIDLDYIKYDFLSYCCEES